MKKYAIYWSDKARYYDGELGEPDDVILARNFRHALGLYMESWGSSARSRAIAVETMPDRVEYYSPAFDRSNVLVVLAHTKATLGPSRHPIFGTALFNAVCDLNRIRRAANTQNSKIGKEE